MTSPRSSRPRGRSSTPGQPSARREPAVASDRDAIAALIYTYAERLDAGELEAVAALFAHATLRSDRHPEIRRGLQQVLEVFQQTVALYDGKPCTQHVTTNLVIEVDGAKGRAAARSKFTVLQARPELPLQTVMAGRYQDRFVRVEGAWRFADRLILVDLLGDLRFHLKRNPFVAPPSAPGKRTSP